MKQGLRSHGFTIIEVLIVLAAMGGMLLIGLSFINGQVDRTEFNQSIRDIQQQIDDTIANVANGYYTNSHNFWCDASTPANQVNLHIPSAMYPVTQNSGGTFIGCTFVGRMIQFQADNDVHSYKIYNLVGLQYPNISDKSVTSNSLSDYQPIALAPKSLADAAVTPDASVKQQLKYGLSFKSLQYNNDDNGGSLCNSVAIAIINADPNSSATSGSGSQAARVFGINLSSPGVCSTVIPVGYDNSYGPVAQIYTNRATPSIMYNSTQNVSICLDSGGTNQSGVITLGGNNGKTNQLVTNLTINSGHCP